MLTALLLVTALAAGVTGAWSPCGLSMVDTLAPGGYARRLRTSLAACATFALGALAGGAVTFGGLALVGAALGAGGPAAAGAAAVVAVAAAAAEARGLRIAPQVRRQVPEAWRRVLPVPLAAAGYGVLLGLGFTTFVLSFAVWALAGTSVALGDPAAGARDRPRVRRRERAAGDLPRAVRRQRPGRRDHRGDVRAPGDPARAAPARRARAGGLRARAGDRVKAPARAAQGAAELFAGSAYDPTAAGGLVAWQRPTGTALILRGGVLRGRFPARIRRSAAGGSRGARATRSWSPTPRRSSGSSVTTRPAPACSRSRTRCWPGARATPRARTGSGSSPRGQAPRVLLETPAPEELGRPALFGGRLLCHVAGPAGSRLIGVDTATGAQELLRAEPGAQVSNPATDGALLLYVHATGRAQELRIGTLEPLAPADDEMLLVHASSGARDREREPGRKRHRHQGRRPELPPRAAPGVVDTLWTTALTAGSAYVTRLHAVRGGLRTADILRVPFAP